MHIVVLTGSPRKQGTTSLLADNFVEGAQRGGHTVVRFDAAFREVHPCRGCNTCQRGVQSCVIQDDMQTLYPDLVRADLVRPCLAPLLSLHELAAAHGHRPLPRH